MDREYIIAPIISEKSIKDAGNGKFTFRVATYSNKKQIKKAIEEKFKVNVIGVLTAIVKGKTIKSGRRRIEITKSPWKKATVILSKGHKIDLFDVGGKS